MNNTQKTFEVFKQALQMKVKTTRPDKIGRRERFFSGNTDDLEASVVALCYDFLKANDNEREVIFVLTNDDNVLWYFGKFIEDMAASIKNPSDNEALLLGLVAVSMVGLNSDPRDISIWIDFFAATQQIIKFPISKSIFKG